MLNISLTTLGLFI